MDRDNLLSMYLTARNGDKEEITRTNSRLEWTAKLEDGTEIKYRSVFEEIVTVTDTEGNEHTLDLASIVWGNS